MLKPRSEQKALEFGEQVEKKLIDIAQEKPETVIYAADEGYPISYPKVNGESLIPC